jgi:hypothetical protein
LFSQENFTKTLLSPNIFKLTRDFPVEKMTLLKTAFITVLLLLTVAAAHFVNLGQANPYVRDWVKEGEVAPPDGTPPPTILILSPKNNTAYASNNVSLTFNASVSEYRGEIYYKASWLQSKNLHQT